MEDNAINRQVVTELLRQEQFNTSIARNGQEAINMVERVSRWKDATMFDAVLMDIQMPVVDGYGATKEIKNILPELPVIAMTAHAMTGEREKCLEVGMNDYVTKPVDPENLFTVLLRCISHGKRKTSFSESKKTSQKPVVFPEKITGIDLKSALERLAGNATLYTQLLKQFIKSNSDTCDQILRDIESGNYESGSKAAHNLKGVAGNIGADSVFKVAGELEQILKEANRGKALEVLQQLTDELNPVIENGKTWLAQVEKPLKAASSQDDRVTDKVTVKPLLQQLAQSLTENDSDAIDVLNSLKRYLGKEYDEDIQHIEELVTELEYENALKALESMPIFREIIQIG